MGIVAVEGFSLTGIEARTTNAAEMSGHGIIPALWGRYVTEFPPAASIYVVYTDYESDEHGPYTYFIGSKTPRAASAPGGVVTRQVPGGNYQVYTSERGPLPTVVPQVWQRIWSEAKGRAYKADFELYDARAANQLDGLVDVYVGLK